MSKTVVNSHGMEFGYELISAIPFAYWLHKHGLLEKTISNKDSKCLYFFSDNHEESIEKRHNDNHIKAIRDKIIPNTNIHKPALNLSRWFPPPYKNHYQNNVFDYDVIVCNKYNVEWREPPINFYSKDMLVEIFNLLKGKRVLYNHMTSDMGRDDKVPSLDLDEWDVVDSFDNVTKIQDLLGGNYSYNEIQMYIYANANLFITVQGGSSILTSFFGGTNIIYAKRGKEINCGSYNRWYNQLGNSNIIHCDSYDKVLNAIKDKL
jgi:hypothetical protein